MDNWLHAGKRINYSNAGAAISAGDVVPITDRMGIAVADIAATTGTGELAVEGVFTLPKATGSAWTIGEVLYWDAGNTRCTDVASNNTAIGYAAAAADSGDTTGRVKINA